MKFGRVGWVVGWGALGMVAFGCGSSSDGGQAYSETNPRMGTATADCGTVQEPLELTLKDVKPALGSSVPNTAIVQSFTIAGRALKIPLSFAVPAAHTAGRANPEPLAWTYALSGTDTVYTSVPFVWQNASGHVELTPPGLLVTPDGCVSVLPNPTFKYDVSAP